jgi:hypothetical protein
VTRSGSGSGDVELRVSANDGAGRQGQVTVAGHTLTVTQLAPAAAPAPAPAPTPGPTPAPTPSCSYEIDPTERFIKDGGGDATVKVKTTSTCSWTAASNVSWIRIKENASGTGSKDVKYVVEKNDSPLPRIGTLTVAGLTHTVFQRGD